MSKFSSAPRPVQVSSPVLTTLDRVPTYEGGIGWARDAKSELFLFAVSNMVSEPDFYEAAAERDERFRSLIATVVAEDPAWIARFVPYLRDTMQMRSASVVMAAEYVKAGGPYGRSVIDSACSRADEPAEVLAYWASRYGRRFPQPVKRGVASAVNRLYNERSALRYDGQNRAWRMGDVIEMVHPKPSDAAKAELFRYLLDARHHGDAVKRLLPTPDLPVLTAAAELDAVAPKNRRAHLRSHPTALADAGMSWERLSSWLPGGMDAEAWQFVIPSMGYMACLAEGTQVWLADGTSAPIEEVVARRLPVLAPNRPFDTTPVRHGPSQPARDRTMGDIVPTLPTEWHSMGDRPVVQIDLVSGRTLEATLDHRWVRRRRNDRRESWEWVTTADLRVGDRLPCANGIEAWGDEGDGIDGYFVGAMLGDGCMTNCGTPEFAQVDQPDRSEMLSFMEDYAAKYGAVFAAAGPRKWRFTFPAIQKRNPITDVLRGYGVWGLKGGEKKLPSRPFSKAFWIGAISGLIDTDGHVRTRRNPKGTQHASLEYASISETLARQVSDALLRLGVVNSVKSTPLRPFGGGEVVGRIFIVSVDRASAVRRCAELLNLRHTEKVRRLAEAAESLPATPYENVEQDRIVAIGEPTIAATYCVTVEPSHAFVANGVITGNCLRNLRNFDDAGISDEAAHAVMVKLSDPVEVARSRQFPLRFLSAWKATGNMRWGQALETALETSVANVPSLKGRTLILIDVSGSMFCNISARSQAQRWEVAGIFGFALARRAESADVVAYDTSSYVLTRSTRSVLRATEELRHTGGGGTYTMGALNEHFKGHDRVLILTDEQAHDAGHNPAIPRIYTFNLGGYRAAHLPSGTNGRFAFGGLTDAGFRAIALLESGKDDQWPF